MGQQTSSKEEAPSFTDVCGALEAGTAPAPPSIPDKFQRLAMLGHLEMDKEIARGLPLRESLRQGGRLWLTCPKQLDDESRSALWARSRPVQHFDMFLSHTWMTPGRWKLLSLLLQSGANKVLVFWVAGVTSAAMLTLLGLLPLPWRIRLHMLDFNGLAPVGPWILLASFLATVFGLLLAPYLPRARPRPDVCFLDVASIHQSDPQLMERGIYGIGGFLSMSSELRVLWSPEYLTRLWCVFELAAFRKAQPNGKITLEPLFREFIVMLLLLMQYFFALVWWATLSLQFDDKYRVTAHMLGTIPCYFVMHLLRKAHVLKHTLFSKLESFDISEARCSSDFDRTFIRTAIVQWYGSEEAFTAFVRGPLREELLTASHCCSFLDYELLLLTPIVASHLTSMCGIWLANAPMRTLASNWIAQTLGLSVLWTRLCIILNLFLCDRFAQPRWSGLRDYFQTLLLYLIFVSFLYAGVALSILANTSSLEAACAWLGFALLCTYLASRMTRMSWRL